MPPRRKFISFAQELVGAVETRFHRLFANAERGCSLLDAELLDHAHHEHHAEGFGQVVYGALQQLSNLAPCCGRLWIGLGREMRHGKLGVRPSKVVQCIQR
jgi:hypothetical protein